MKKILFIDRDGSILKEPHDEQIDSFEKMEFLPGVIGNLSKIHRELDYEFVMVTNQDGLGTSSFPEKKFLPVQNLLLNILKNEGVTFQEILIDKSFPKDNAPTRKPRTGMLTHYIKGHYDIKNSFVIGDRESDVQLAKNLGCRAIYISRKKNKNALVNTKNWNEIYSFLKSLDRTVSIERKTNETEINISLNMDGSGKSNISTGLGFFNHMLEQFAKHGNCDLKINVKGDTHIDEHHTIEDVGITLGEAFHKALGSKKGISRYGFLLPMDDCLAQVAVDFSGRSWLVWNAKFKREKIGDMPTEMFKHFFKSFCDSAKCNLNIKAEGKNEHHKIEAIFKATARAVRMAVEKISGSDLPTTKGLL